MSKNKVYQGQSFLDKALELTGDLGNAFQMALLNEISITDDLPIGKEVKATNVSNAGIVGFFNEFNRPATCISFVGDDSQQGIGYMVIGKNFIVG
jgi:hypothetical protein